MRTVSFLGSLPALAVLTAVTLAIPASAQQVDLKVQKKDLKMDSGYIDNLRPQATVVYTTTVEFQKAWWIRVLFDQTNLPKGSELQIESADDQAVQRLDGFSLIDYGRSSCYLNGGKVTVKLVAGPNTKANRVLIVGVEGTLGMTATGATICGTKDDRKASTDKRQGRLNSGCTGWLINAQTMLTAGHCTSSSSARIISFNVPLSSSSGRLRASSPNDQYPTNLKTQRRSTGFGNDWAVVTVLRNSNTKKLPGIAQGSWYELGGVPSSTSNQTIRITGYGTAAGVLNQAQKTHTGPFSRIASSYLQYRTDTTGGNSGSPVIHENTGKAIGVHTHGGCSRSGGANSGTRIDRPAFVTARNAVMSAQKIGQIVRFGSGCTGSNSRTPSLNVSGVADIGKKLTATLSSAPPSASTILFVGFSNTTDRGVKLPLDLTKFGMKNCKQLVSLDVPVLGGTSSSGVAQFVANIPFLTSLIAKRFYIQYAINDGKANAFGVITSNGVLIELGT